MVLAIRCVDDLVVICCVDCAWLSVLGMLGCGGLLCLVWFDYVG